VHNEDVRIAYMFQPVTTIPDSYVTVQVAETLNKRDALTSRILSGVLLPQFVIIPIAVVLVYFGLARGLRPLNRLQKMIEKRRPTDLSPIDVKRAPEELRPLIHALNDMMLRLETNLVAQQRFIADAAHQMRTPLTGLKSQAELALLENDPVQIRACMEHIFVSATQLGPPDQPVAGPRARRSQHAKRSTSSNASNSMRCWKARSPNGCRRRGGGASTSDSNAPTCRCMWMAIRCC
jgi:two-component system sensor histidine kinase TctE